MVSQSRRDVSVIKDESNAKSNSGASLVYKYTAAAYLVQQVPATRASGGDNRPEPRMTVISTKRKTCSAIPRSLTALFS